MTGRDTTIAALKSEFEPLLAKLPKEAFDREATVLRRAADGDYGSLLAEIAPTVIDRIAQKHFLHAPAVFKYDKAQAFIR